MVIIHTIWTFWAACCWVVCEISRNSSFHFLMGSDRVIFGLSHCPFNLLRYDQVSYFPRHWFVPRIWRVHIHLKEGPIIWLLNLLKKCPPWKRSAAYCLLLWPLPDHQLWQWRQTDSTFHPRTVQLLYGSTFRILANRNKILKIVSILAIKKGFVLSICSLF